MKTEYEYEEKIHVKALVCDNPDCRNVVQDDDTQKEWLGGAFQCGMNQEGKIATWCSEKCYKSCNK
jgi:hypothetical protein